MYAMSDALSLDGGHECDAENGRSVPEARRCYLHHYPTFQEPDVQACMKMPRVPRPWDHHRFGAAFFRLFGSGNAVLMRSSISGNFRSPVIMSSGTR